MILLDATGPSFENRITLGQVLEIACIIGGFAITLVRKYLRSEEDAETLKEQTKGLVDMQGVQIKLAGTQSQQQTLIEQMDKRLTRVEDWKERQRS